MANIRPFQASDLPAVAALLKAHMREWRHDERFLAGTLVDHPWADEEIPSLVAVDEREAVVGFVGAQVRRVVLDGRPLRGVCVSHLVVESDKRVGAAGALLLRELLAGAQDVSWTDSANDAVVRMWRTFGGEVDYARSCDWMLVLRPLRWFAGMGRVLARREPLARRQVPVGAMPVHAGPGVRTRRFPALSPGVSSEDATADEIAEHLPALSRGVRLRVDYDGAVLDHTFAQVEAASGRLVRRLVRRDGQPIGWYAYLRLPAGVGRTLHVAAARREAEGVIGSLIQDARADGRAVLAGRAEPGLEDPLQARLAVLGFARKPMIHTRDPEIRALLPTAEALLTQLDSEWYVT